MNQPAYLDFPQYKTSSPEVKSKFEEFQWCIIAEFFNGDDAYDFEQQLIYENWNHPLILNKSCFYGKKRFKSFGTSLGKIRISDFKSKSIIIDDWNCKC